MGENNFVQYRRRKTYSFCRHSPSYASNMLSSFVLPIDRCYCSKKEEQAQESQRSSSSAERTDPRGRRCAPTVFSLPQAAKCSSTRIDESAHATIACHCSAERLGSKRALAISSSDKDARSDYPSIEQHEYTTASICRKRPEKPGV